MTRRALVTMTAASSAVLLTACSLLVSTSDLSSPADAASIDGSSGGGDAAADALTPIMDATSESDVDAARDPHLLAEYSFEDAPGQIAHDTSGNDLHALLQLDATFIAGGVSGRALGLSGGGFMVVDALAGNLRFPTSGTLSVWFLYTFSKSSTQARSIFDSWDNTRSHLFIRRADGANGSSFQIAAQSTTTNGAYAYAASFDAEQSVWTHVVLTWDAVNGAAAFYANGTLLRAGPYELAFDTSGQHFRLGDGLVGAIDEVRLFDRAFTADEVMKLK